MAAGNAATAPRGRGRPRTVSWTDVRRLAQLGSNLEEIVAALDISPEVLRDPAIIARFRREIDGAHARLKVSLRQRIQQRGRGKGRGSPNVLALQARNTLGWDRPRDPASAKDTRPDAEAAIAELERMLEAVRKQYRAIVAAGGPCPACSIACRYCGQVKGTGRAKKEE